MTRVQYISILFISLLLQLQPANVWSQSGTPRYKIAIFIPLFLDSVFDNNNQYRYPNNVFPKFLNPGLEFFEGASLALDSLKKQNANLEIFVYDTRATKNKLSEQLLKPEIDSLSLIITHCASSEVKLFADLALKKKIPVVNVNMPNDGGVSANFFYTLLNPTLRTQCEGIYKHLQKYYSLNPIVVFRKKGVLEDRIKMYFDDFANNTLSVPLKLKYVELTDSFTAQHLRPHLDTVQYTVCLTGSLDENFGKQLIRQLAALHKQKYHAIVMGMPTWDNIGEFGRAEYKGIEIIYSHPFYNAQTDKMSIYIKDYFTKNFYARPSDMFFRGYEVTWKFVNLLIKYGKDFPSGITSKEYNVFTNFDIQPVLNITSMTLDYFENKNLSFLKWQDGVLKGVY